MYLMAACVGLTVHTPFLKRQGKFTAAMLGNIVYF